MSVVALNAAAFSLFDTAIGPCALAWNSVGLTAVGLPGVSALATRKVLLSRQPQAVETPPPWPDFVAAAVAAMQAHLAGEPQDLREVPLDTSQANRFELLVYAAARELDPGHTCSYGELAKAIGEPMAARAVGHALGENPWPLVVPCHRVTAAGGRLGGFSAPGGSDTKQRLLLLEAAMVKRPDQLF